MKIKPIADRLKQPSTWAGISALAALAGLPPDLLGPIGQIVMGIGGVLAVVLKGEQ